MTTQTGNRMAVENLTEGMLVDLEGDSFFGRCFHEVCPDPGKHESDAKMVACEYAVVVGVERETAECVRVDFEGLDSVGFPVGHTLPVCDD